MQHAVNILGEPSDKEKYYRWTAYVPILGLALPNGLQTVYHYKNIGTVQFQSGAATSNTLYVRYVKYNPDESGYAGETTYES